MSLVGTNETHHKNEFKYFAGQNKAHLDLCEAVMAVEHPPPPNTRVASY
jgi:hypothetical protein